MALSILSKKPSIKNVLKWIFSGLCVSFIAMLVIMLVLDTVTGTSSQTAEYCAKYGFLASPGCW
ncbi:MAG: hypothetical protein AB7F53_06660 [Nitrososphaeraceae archaeon]|jgi:hypothetical protein